MSDASASALPPRADADRPPGWPIGLAGLLALAATLRVHGLSSQLWLDEMDAVMESIRRPAAHIVTAWPAATSHVFFDLCSHACLRALGESPLAVRLPAALFGVAGVAAVALLTAPVLGNRVALAASALLAVSYHHVFYSQNARGYTALLFFALLAARSFLRLRTGSARRRVRAEYVLCGALAAYSVLFGVFVVAAHVVIAGALRLFATLRRQAPLVARRHDAGPAALAILLIAMLYAPFAPRLVRFAEQQARLPAGASQEHAGRVSRMGVASDAAEGLARGMGGAVGLFAAALVVTMGAALWARRDALSLIVLTAPVVLELVVLLAVDVPLSPRYFTLALAPVVIAGGQGLVALADGLTSRLAEPLASRCGAAIMVAAVAASALPLARYYRVPKQDFQGAIDRVAALAGEGDGRVAVHYAARGIVAYHRAAFQDVQALSELERQERGGRRLWLVTTLERFLAAEAPALHAHIKASYRPVAVLPATVGGAEMTIYEGKEARF